MRSLRFPAAFAVPLLLLLPSCGGEAEDGPGTPSTEAEVQPASEEAVVYSDVPEAQAAFDESIDLWSSDGPASIAKLKEAIELDPSFVEAHGLLSMRYAWVHQNYDRSDSIADQARMHAERAMEMDPGNEMSINAMGNYHYRILKDYPAAVQHYARGGQLYPDQPVFVRMQAHAARRSGDWDEALELLFQAEEMEPSLGGLQAIAENHDYNRRWDQAVAAYEEYQERNPESTLAPSNLAWIAFARTGDTGPIREFLAGRPTGWPVDRWNMEMLDRDYEAALAALDYSDNEVFRGQYGIHPKTYYQGVALKWLGDEAGAESAFMEAREIMEGMLPELDHDCRVHAGLADIYVGLGLRDEAVAAARKAIEVMPVEKDALVGPYNRLTLARVYSVLGEAEAAVEELRFLLEIPSALTRTHLRVAPVWDSIREHPSFQALLEG